MSEYESLRHEIIACAKAIDGYSDTAVRHLLEQSTQIDKLWADNAELRDELHALANRVETLTRARLTEPAETAARMVDRGQGFTCTQVGCYLVYPHEHHHADGHIIIRGDAA